jgi:hypothetical protein
MIPTATSGCCRSAAFGADTVINDLERKAETWIQPYADAHHFRRTRDWALRLEPSAPLAGRLAALTQ